MGSTRWPAAVQVIADSIAATVTAVRAGDHEAFDDAIGTLVRADTEPLAVVLGEMTRDLLERTHPDGLDSDDAEAVLRECASTSANWYPEFDVETALHALAGALAVDDPEAWAGLDRRIVIEHGLILITVLLASADQPAEPVVEAALRELMRAQTIENP